MLRSLLEGWRSEGGGAKRRFMGAVGKDMKLVGVRVRKKKKKTKGRKQMEAGDWLRPHLEGTAGRKKNTICSSSHMCAVDSCVCSQSAVKV